ncbi:MAG: T9SS type A sorting domain-containing protein [Flavobacteriales bacterium]
MEIDSMPTNTPKQKDKMRRIFGAIMVLLISTAVSANDPISETGVEIYPTIVNTELNIEIDEQLATGKVTVSVFNSIGEIVLEETLDLGLNKLDTSHLENGAYVAVVRQNFEYKSKQSFEVI